jgi:FkbM family methyltransferase
MVKSLGKATLRRLVRSLPWGGRQAIIGELTRTPELYWTLLKELAARSNIVGVQVDGSNGRLLGSLRDEVIVRAYVAEGRWAERSLRLLAGVFEGRGGTYVDVGANIGATTIPVARDPAVRCLALEPEPGNYANLVANVQANCRHGNVELRQVAVFSEPSRLRFELSPHNLGDHRLRLRDGAAQMGEEQWEVIEVEAAPLDELVPPVEGPLAVKIDVQGAEPFVVAGGRRTIAAADLVIMEFSPYWMNRMGGDVSGLLKFLSNVGPVAIASAETGELGAPLSGAVACERLAALPADTRTYVDVVFGRALPRVVPAIR